MGRFSVGSRGDSLKFWAVAFAILLSFTSQAGDVLHLKAGKVKIDQINSTSETLWEKVKTLMGAQTPLKNKYFVVQYTRTISKHDLALLGSQKISVANYMPDDALVVRLEDPGQLRSLEHFPDVRGVVPYLPEWKISPELSLLQSTKTVSLLVRLLRDEDGVAYKNFLQDLNVTFRGLSQRTFYIQLPFKQVTDVCVRDEVEWAEPWTKFHTMNFESRFPGESVRGFTEDLTGLESGSRVIGADKAWIKGLHGENQLIGVADTGVDTGILSTLHKDLTQVLKGVGLSRTDHKWLDRHGHGTHVAGSIIGSGAQSKWKIVGSAPGAKLYVQSVMDENGYMRLSGPATILTKAYEEGVRIHSNSWGSEKTHYDNSAASYDEFIWKHPEMLVLFAAGNSGGDFDQDGVVDENSVGSPGTAKNVLTVGASENKVDAGGLQITMGNYSDERWPASPLFEDKFSDNINGMAGFSARGPVDDGRRKPDVVAPGSNILSTRTQIPDTTAMWGVFNDHYIFSGGTSMATPLTAGAAALIRQNLTVNLQIENPSAALMKAIIMHTADDLFPGQYGTGKTQEIPTQRPNNVEGYGRVNIEEATQLPSTKLFDEKLGVGGEEQKDYSFKLNKGQTLRLTLNYTDYPGLVSSAQALVNDLDLLVISPDGEAHKVSDRVNNNEYLEVIASRSGNFSVSVLGHKVLKGLKDKQSYALVVSIK
jgi:serine protease AprX